MTWQCTNCLQTNPDGTGFCGHCGARAAEVVAAADDLARGVAQSAAELAASAQPGGVPASEFGEQRRLITVVFADVSGFTPLADRLDAEEVAAAIDPILARMAEIIKRYDGHVHQYAGDAVIAFFGAPVAHEDDAVRALLAARDMHREVAEVVAELPAEVQHVQLHIGVNTGHVVTGFRRDGVRLDYYALGDAVNVAARLEAACPVGEVYVGELTRRLAGTAVSFEAVGDLVVKGKPMPVPAWRLAGDNAPVATAPGQQAILGRDGELAVVSEALATVRTGVSGMLGIVGEPGVGKSRLLQEMRELAEGAGMRWLATRCLSYGAALAYRPYLDLLHGMAGVQVGDPPEHVRARICALAHDLGLQDDELPYLTSVAGVPAPEIPDPVRTNAQALRVRVQEALVAVVLAAASRSPLVLAIEDVHWMDSASATVTALLMSRSGNVPVCVALTTRPEGCPVVAKLAGTRPPNLVELTGLEPGAVHRMAEGILGGPLESGTTDRLLARTGGNALFVQEVVRSLIDADVFVRTPSGWAIDPGSTVPEVPSNVESVLAARIDMLPEEAADALLVASVIGRDVRLPLLRALVSKRDESLDRIVDTLVARQFMDRVADADDQRVVFHHALVADVAYGRLLRKRRRTLHRRLLETALRLYGDGDDSIDLLARNAYLGGMGADGLPYIERAADRATALFANAEALTFLEQAIEIVEADATVADRLPDLLTKLARLQERTGRFEAAVQTYHRVHAMTRAASAAISEAAALGRIDRVQDCLDLLDAVESEHADLTPEQRARIAVERGRASALSGHPPVAVEVLTAGLAELAAAGLSGSVAEAELLTLRARLLEVSSAMEDGLADTRRAAATLEAHGDMPRLVTTLRVMGGICSDLPDGQAEGIAILERALQIARQVGHAEEIGAVSINLGWALWSAGRREEAMDYERGAAVAFESMGLRAGVANAKVNLTDHLMDLERWDEAEQVCREALELAREAGHQVWYAGAVADLGEIAMNRGEYQTAVSYAEEAEALFTQMGDEKRAAPRRELIERARALMAARG